MTCTPIAKERKKSSKLVDSIVCYEVTFKEHNKNFQWLSTAKADKINSAEFHENFCN